MDEEDLRHRSEGNVHMLLLCATGSAGGGVVRVKGSDKCDKGSDVSKLMSAMLSNITLLTL